MRKIFIALFSLAASALFAAEATISLAEARGKIGEAVVNPAVMTSTMKMLPADSQKAFLADCNEAIDKMPGSAETKAAAYLTVNRAALKGAAKGNVLALLAEVFATVPPEALTVINERFAADLFNRAADPSVVYTDSQFAHIAESVMENVMSRTAKTDGADVRNVFAVIMLLRASNGTPADLAAKLVAGLPEATRKTALEEWIPAAMSESRNYDLMLGAADAGEQPNYSLVLQLATPQTLDAMLGDLNTGVVGEQSSTAATFKNASDVVTTVQVATQEIGLDSGLSRRPMYYREPEGYQWQTIGARKKR